MEIGNGAEGGRHPLFFFNKLFFFVFVE